MISKVARNDVVRVLRTGEVGLVKGWADHENLAANGTILDIAVGGGRTIQANGNALEFVARAKPTWTTAKRVWWTFATLFAMAYGSYFGWIIAKHDVGIASSVFVGFSAHFFAYYALKAWTVYPRRTRVTLPKTRTTTARQQRTAVK